MDEKVVKNLVNGLKNYENLNQLSQTLDEIQASRVDKNVHIKGGHLFIV